MTEHLRAPSVPADPLIESTIKWFDGTDLNDVLVHQTQKVVTALVDAGHMHSIYGAATRQNGYIVKRNGKGYVINADILIDLFDETCDAAWVRRLSNVFVDESVVLGQAARPDISRDPGPESWEFPCFGIINLDDYVPGLFLKPTKVSFHSRVTDDGFDIRIIEQSNSKFTKGKLSLSLSPVVRSARITTLETQAEFLVDVAGNGGWERVRPLWIRTNSGFLRAGTPDHMAASPFDVRGYDLPAESRALDLTSMASFLEEHASCVAHLDASGNKTIRFSFSRSGLESVSLEVDDPCIGAMFTKRTCNPSDMAISHAPPSDVDIEKGTPLYLISLPAVSDALSIPDVTWQVELGNDQLRLNGAVAGIPVHHYAPYDNLVMGPAAAANEANAEITPLRALIPQRLNEDEIVLQMSPKDIEIGMSGKVDWQLAAHSGLVTRYGFDGLAWPVITPHVEQEIDASGASHIYPNEPAVLRNEYCHLHTSETEISPIESTYVFNEQGTLKYSTRERAVSADPAAKLVYAMHPQDGISSRVEDAIAVAVDRFGWWSTQRFYNGRAPNGPVFPHDLLELNKMDSGWWQARQWCRLSDDSLVHLPPRDDLASDGDDPFTFWPKPKFRFLTSFGTIHFGLANFQLTEEVSADGSEFTLWNDKNVLWESKSEAERPKVINRLVIASSCAEDSVWDIGAELGYGITTKKINRIFIELYRWGKQWKLARCMLGWGAAKVFGFESKGTFHVTEYIEAYGDTLKRSIELNGHVTVLKEDSGALNSITSEAFFWAAIIDETQPAKERCLRVLCKHELFFNGLKSVKFVALHDARIVGNELDLSSDLVLMGLDKPSAGTISAEDAWEPDRRRLFKARIDPVSNLYSAKAFMRLRYVAPPPDPTERLKRLVVEKPPVAHVPTIIPAWAECMTQITPWFTNGEEDRRQRSSWLGGNRLLRDISVLSTGLELQVTVSWLGTENEIAPEPRACTLVATTRDSQSLDDLQSVPTWVPCPVGSLVEIDTNIEDVDKSLTKLWLFAPWPQITAHWPTGAGIEEENRKRAKTILVQLGWTREAVIETTDDTGLKRWSVVDSPLLNRDSHMGWFGWPLYSDSEQPKEILASSEQIVHKLPGSHSRVGIQTVFNDDIATGSLLVKEPLVDPCYAINPSQVGFGNMVFRPCGLRIGVLHQVIRFGAGTPTIMELMPSVLPPVKVTEDLEVVSEALFNGNTMMRLRWGQVPALAVQNVITSAAGVQLKFEPVLGGWNSIKPLQGPPGLAIKADGKWLDVDYRTNIKVAEPIVDGLEVRLPASQPWSQIILTLAQFDIDGKLVHQISRSFFVDNEVSRTWTGVFVKQKIQAFGAEPARFWLTGLDLARPWTRASEFTLTLPSSDNSAFVVDIDSFGRMLAHVKLNANSL